MVLVRIIQNRDQEPLRNKSVGTAAFWGKRRGKGRWRRSKRRRGRGRRRRRRRRSDPLWWCPRLRA